MYAIVFDFDTEMLKNTYPNQSWNNAYLDVRTYLTAHGFNWMQGSAYFGDDSVDAIRCVRVVQKMAVKFPWFKSSVRDIRMLRIEENNDLKAAFEDDDAD
ncbi:MAG: virulence factor [Hyphomicrobiales bacterium]|nr:virulence factor [Hyphomicrobiales bacterium]MDE2114607.1 virulence factor [Hyphomicrobiales bacterium]